MIQSATRHSQLAIVRHAAAVVLYVAFAVYLYCLPLGRVMQCHAIVPVSAVVAALGGFVLTRRWVAGFAGSFLAGALCGFSPFFLGVARYHSSVSVLVASIPWLCAPAVFVGRRRHIACLPLALLPFAAVVLFFRVSAAKGLFAAPLGPEPHLSDAFGFIAPLVMWDRSAVVVSVYHVAIAPLILGLAVMVTARRYGLLLLFAVGLVLAFSRSYLPPDQIAWLGVSPILWLSIPMVSLAVLAAVGLQGLIEAGFSDKKWLLIAAAGQALLAIVMLLLATKYFQFIFHLADPYARLFVEEAKMYLLGMVALGMVFWMAYRRLRLQWLRWLILATALSLDIFLTARYLVDTVL
jgi:hypothetical protein